MRVRGHRVRECSSRLAGVEQALELPKGDPPDSYLIMVCPGSGTGKWIGYRLMEDRTAKIDVVDGAEVASTILDAGREDAHT